MLRKPFVYISLVVSIFFVANSCKDDSSNEAKVKGRIKNISENYFLATRECNDTLTVDTIKVNDRGEFSVKFDVDTLTIVSMYFNNKSRYSYFVLDKNWDVEINGDTRYAEVFDIQGGDVNNELTAFRKQNNALLRKRSSLVEQLVDTTNNSDTLLVNKKNDYVSELANLNFDLSNSAAEYVKSNPDKISSVFIINAFFKDESFLPRLDESLNLLRGKAATFSLTKELLAYSSRVKKSQEGVTAPYFMRNDVNDKSFSITSHRGKYVLLSFASTTSKLSKEQREPLMEIYKNLKKEKENIEFVTVLVDVEESPIPAEIKKQIDWTLIEEKGGWTSELLQLYNIKELPNNILISPSGIIVKRDIPTFIIEDVYNELSGKNKK